MYYMYVLRNQNGEVYIGSTGNLKTRLNQHFTRQVRSTKHDSSWKLCYFEAYAAKSDGLKREIQLKRFAKSFAMLKKRIAASLDA
jgi:putative endonuclease